MSESRLRTEHQETPRMTRSKAALVLALAATAACSDNAGTVLGPASRSIVQAAPSGGTKYKLRVVSGVNPAGDGEIQSPWFPDAGVTLNTRSPWKSLTISGATITLVNYTHGDWSAASCAGFFNKGYPVNVTTWDIASTAPVLSFAGSWYGTLTISQTSSSGVAFDGDRVIDGVVTPGRRRDPQRGWRQHHHRDAGSDRQQRLVPHRVSRHGTEVR